MSFLRRLVQGRAWTTQSEPWYGLGHVYTIFIGLLCDFAMKP